MQRHEIVPQTHLVGIIDTVWRGVSSNVRKFRQVVDNVNVELTWGTFTLSNTGTSKSSYFTEFSEQKKICNLIANVPHHPRGL